MMASQNIHVTALNRQTFPLFRNAGDGLFEDTTARSGLHRLTVSKSGWATKFEDFDNDGLKDLFVTASHVNDLAREFENASYRQSNAVFGNTGRGTFEDVAEAAAIFMPAAHRGRRLPTSTEMDWSTRSYRLSAVQRNCGRT